MTIGQTDFAGVLIVKAVEYETMFYLRQGPHL